MEWLLFQLDVKKAFLCEDLKEKVYMEQPLGYVTQGRMLSTDLKRQFMDSNKVQGHGLRSSAWLSLVLDLLVVIQITQSLFVILTQAQYMLMIFY